MFIDRSHAAHVLIVVVSVVVLGVDAINGAYIRFQICHQPKRQFIRLLHGFEFQYRVVCGIFHMLNGVVLAVREMVVVWLFIGKRVKTIKTGVGCTTVFGPVPPRGARSCKCKCSAFWLDLLHVPTIAC